MAALKDSAGYQIIFLVDEAISKRDRKQLENDVDIGARVDRTVNIVRCIVLRLLTYFSHRPFDVHLHDRGRMSNCVGANMRSAMSV